MEINSIASCLASEITREAFEEIYWKAIDHFNTKGGLKDELQP